MFYEVYIDIFFAVNAMLDFFVIELAENIQHYKSTMKRKLLAAMTGSLILCIFISLPFRRQLLVRVFFYVTAFLTMAVIAFPHNRKRSIMKSVLTLYGVSIFVNGIYRWLSLKIEHSFQLLASGIVVYLLIYAIWFVYRQSRSFDTHICAVNISFHGQNIALSGLWDTGNRLRSPYHGKGVSVINYDSIREWISDDMKKCIETGRCTQEYVLTAEEKLFFIPYQTVESANGMMAVVTAENMTVEKNGEKLEYKKPLLGISRIPVSQKDLFQIIVTTEGA